MRSCQFQPQIPHKCSYRITDIKPHHIYRQCISLISEHKSKIHRKQLEHKRSVGEIGVVAECFSPLLECSSCFLVLYKKTEYSQGFPICFTIKSLLNSLRISFKFQNKLYFLREQQCCQHAQYYNRPHSFN